jgi:hydrogenase/urease accessory protein HupE
VARRGVFPIAFALTFSLVFCAPRTSAHPLLQNAIDVVIGPDRVVIDARIAAEELLIVETTDHKPPPPEQCAALATKHAAYVRDHVQLVVDGQPVNAASWTAVNPGAAELRNDPTNFGPPVAYHLEYALSRPPAIVTIRQNFLREYNNWSASCVLRERQSTEPDFDLGLLPSLSDAEFDCTWPAAPPTSHPGTAPAASTDVNVGATIREYVKHGIWHILTGYDHMLFVSALVLGAAYFWDLFKVVTAFTLAHTITLTLCVFNIVRLSEHIVEPMIAASIVIVAAQNVFFPERARGWLRLAAAFGFGLFHGLGFAGGLKDAMAGLPNIALWSALGSFSLGVEVGHQMVVIPLFLLLFTARNWRAETPRLTIANRTRQIASSAICLAGAYFFVQAIRL